MQNNFKKQLLQYKKKTIFLTDLEKMVGKQPLRYVTFAEEILKLEEEDILQMVKAKGRNRNTPSLAYQYRINRALLNKDYHAELHRHRFKFDHSMNLDAYFSLDETTWTNDLPYLEKINTYITENGFPEAEAPAPERSFELVGDEKWLVEGQGSEVLARIDLWEKFKIMPVSDPLMFAVHPALINQETHLHLIVENKTTYQALLPILTNTVFTTLIYGSGNKITKSIENFPNQLPIEGRHTFYYFGDIDQSGITIWHSLNIRREVLPATPFYQACLQKNAAFGKTNQRPNEKALEEFLQFFPATVKEKIRKLLADGAYYPQEVLKTSELQAIWEGAAWRK